MSINYFKQHSEFSNSALHANFLMWNEVASSLLVIGFGLPRNNENCFPSDTNLLLVKTNNSYTNIPHYADFYT
jgi:hypothetical protein